MPGLNDFEMQEFMERISATTIANQAILKCSLAGMPLTADNVILFIGDFFDPGQPQFEGLVAKIEAAIDEVVAQPWRHASGRKLV